MAYKVYCSQDGPIQVHQTRVTPYPSEFPAGYYWNGGKRQGPGRPPKLVEIMLLGNTQSNQDNCDEPDPADGVSKESVVDDQPSTDDTLKQEQ